MIKGEVFVVDDEAGIRLLLSEIIRQEDFNVSNFEQSDVAFKQALASPPKLIFLDYLIEPTRGDRFVKKLSEHSVGIPVVLMSGMAKQELEDNLGDLRVMDILEKPFSVEEVKKILQQLSVDV
ncbi:response regulator [Aquisalibacillus elongatus]|uniref:Two-component system response regulator (Stage 0 sporulation protein F) n=1 Tax=Aquisalibacillus elongatus TaxID=485577 RepID=A0A3N5B9K7_9BACI|nr:response regulator [Aquisalibacillus elongatus]RPF54083.1 two-component system response regulator (stage 0 sporulation protein F) [Aquisalibacillus elongatus]